MIPNANMRVAFSPANRAWSIVWGDSFVRLEPIDAGGKMPLFFDRRAQLVRELERRGIEVLRGGVIRSKNPGSGIKVRTIRASNPRAPLAVGERVSIPYTGRSSYFGRKVTRTHEKGTVEGVNADGSVHVRVPRGKGAEAHTFPASHVRRLPQRGTKAVGSRVDAAKSRLDLKAQRDRLRATRAALTAAKSEQACLEAQAKAAVPDSPEFRNLVSKMTRLRNKIDAQHRIVGELERSDPGYVDPWAPPRANVRRRRHKNPHPALERGLKTFRKWHDFDAQRVVRLEGQRRQPRVLVKLGDVPEIIYRSNKWEGRLHTYSHKCSRPYPTLATGENGKGLYLVGGRTIVTPAGLKH